jgi:hypothetical protein
LAPFGTNTDGDACHALNALARAVDVHVETAAGGGEAHLAAIWTRAIGDLSRARCSTATRLGLGPTKARPSSTQTPSSEPDAAVVERALLSLFVPAGLSPPPVDQAPLYGATRAAARVNAALPPLFEGLVDALLRDVPAVFCRSTIPAPVPSSAIAPGKRIADYVVERVLGAGGMGQCVLVRRRLERDQKNARRWVLKLPQSAELAEPFRNEAMALLHLSRSHHPGIVRFVSFVDYGHRTPFLLMEWIEGESLEARMRRGPLPLGDVVAIGRAMAEAVAHSHSMQVCHYDIKPANVVLAAGAHSRPVLVDWGLAGAAYPWAGTPEYMAPERFEATRAGGLASPNAADVFAIGCVLAEMHSGHPLIGEPITEEDTGERGTLLLRGYRAVAEQFRRNFACEAIAKDASSVLTRRLEHALAGAPRAFVDLVRATLDARPEARPPAREVAERLGALMSSSCMGTRDRRDQDASLPIKTQ